VPTTLPSISAESKSSCISDDVEDPPAGVKAGSGEVDCDCEGHFVFLLIAVGVRGIHTQKWGASFLFIVSFFLLSVPTSVLLAATRKRID
jgi:hypothetical protein